MLELPFPILHVLNIFSPVFSVPVWRHVLNLVSGFYLGSKNQSISNILRMAGKADQKGWQKYYDVFRRARWSCLKLSKVAIKKLCEMIPVNEPLIIVIDETVEERTGPHIKAIGYFIKKARSFIGGKGFTFGHKWLVAAVLIKVPWCTRHLALPVFTRLTRAKKLLASSKNKSDKERTQKHRTFPELTAGMIKTINRWIGQIRYVIYVADGAFQTHTIYELCCRLNGCDVITRIKGNSTFHEAPPPKNGKCGRPKIKGARINLQKKLKDPRSNWVEHEVTWYGGIKKTVLILTGINLWCPRGKRPLELTWVIVKDPEGKMEPIFLASSSTKLSPLKILTYFIRRWNIEVTFQEAREHLGFDTQRNWSDKAVDRVTPCVLGMYTLTVLIAISICKVNKMEIPKRETSWYSKKTTTFSDIHAFVRKEFMKAVFYSITGDKDSCAENTKTPFVRRVWEMLMAC